MLGDGCRSGIRSRMHQLSDDLKGTIVGFLILLSKGLLDDERWDWDLDNCDWSRYQSAFSDPTILRTTISVFLNKVTIDDRGAVANYKDARFRGFQYFRTMIDSKYSFAAVLPRFEPSEMKEPDWCIWET